jgi:nucleotide-binding universal stress UspA family protein
MTYKTILTALAPAEEKQAAAEYAISMAQTFQAHLAAYSYALQPTVPGAGLPWVPRELVEGHVANVLKQADSVLRQLQDRARQANVETSCEVVRTGLNNAVATFAAEARVCDIAVVSQSQPGLEHAGDLFAEAVLFHSGRPLLVVPHNHREAFSARRVLIAWDGSQHAARAVRDALPVLALASKAELLVVGDEKAVKRSHAAKMIANLQRHNISTDFICHDDSDHARMIEQEAKSLGASLLVMGGYGRARARELLFGGVTRSMLNDTPLPVLMAH